MTNGVFIHTARVILSEIGWFFET